MTPQGFYIWALLSALCVRSFAAENPNIVLILADDLGYGDVRCLNPAGKISTPHLDRLAAGGMRFTSYRIADGGLATGPGARRSCSCAEAERAYRRSISAPPGGGSYSVRIHVSRRSPRTFHGHEAKCKE